MRDGIYALQFSADGYSSQGELRLEENRGEGHDGTFKLEGRLIEAPSNLTAVFSVLMLPEAVKNARLPEHYSLNMLGTANDDVFSLIGAGPLGIIIDIDCRWERPLAADSD